MKKISSILATIIAVIATLIYVSDAFLGIDLVHLIVPDTVAPEVNVEEINTNVELDSDFDLSSIVCEDNYSEECDVEIIQDIDTSVVGEQTLKVKVTDEAGNSKTYDIVITVFEGINPALYIPDNYYDNLDYTSTETLINTLNDIITGHTEYKYTDKGNIDVWEIMKDADEDPDNPDNVIAFYMGISLPKICQDTTYPPEECNMSIDGVEKTWEWNREHIWSKSRGDFEYEDSSVQALGAHTDLHHLVAAERTMNSTKNNRHFEDCHDGDDTNIVDRGYGNYTCNDWEFEPRDEVKGDVARMLFYMAIRYQGEEGDYVDLELVNDPDSTKSVKLPLYGDLDDLLRWHLEDPVDMKEIERNNVIFGYQNNRNPFIDMPDLATLIWGSPEDYN